MAEDKTNVMRLLDQKKIPYAPRRYDVSDGALDGATAAARLGIAPETCFKTLVTVGASKQYHVFVIPVERELDLKAAAKAARLAGDVADFFKYAGCSPIGMKKRFPTIIDAPAEALPEMTVSAGKIGRQITLSPQDLAGYTGAVFRAVSRQTGGM